VVFSLFLALLANLYQLQIRKGYLYAARAESQVRLAGFLEPKRGAIFFTDRHNNKIPVALNKDFPVVFAVPRQVTDVPRVVDFLSNLFSEDKDVISKHFVRSDDPYELIATKVSDSHVEAVREADLAGVFVDSQSFRFYPFSELAAHFLGFVGPSSEDNELRGRYGVESYYDDELRGSSGEIKGAKIVEPVDGSDIAFTIDRDIQAQAEDILSKTIEKTKATGGTVIVEEPFTGKILALANRPTFDPNNYAKSPISYFLNPAVQSIYEPGSVMKVMTMSGAIESGSVAANTTYTDTGSLVVGPDKITNAENAVYGKVTMTEVIEHSINTGAAFAMKAMGSDTFLSFLKKFGLNEKTGISLPGEVSTNLKTLYKNAPELNFVTASFGQGIAVTPISLISAVSAIANDGVLMKPFIRVDEKPTVVRKVISKKTADTVTDMMASAVYKAKIAQVPGYTVAGKTGTAQIPNFSTGGYTKEFIHTFVGFAPASDPKFIILFKVDKPQVGALAGLTVVPAFRELAEFILSYYAIPPDALNNLGTQ